MATVQDILDQALNLNRKTQSDALIATLAPEVVEAVNRSLRGIYQIGARVNPAYFGKTSTPGESSGVWTHPSDAELVYHVQDAGGDTVLFSGPKEPIPDSEKLYLIKWGKTWTRPSGATNPTGTLTAYYSRRPSTATALTSTVDLEDFFQALLVTDLGAWIAHKDERFDEKGLLLSDRETYLRLLVGSLQSDVSGLARNVGQTGTFDTARLTELQSLLLTPAG